MGVRVVAVDLRAGRGAVELAGPCSAAVTIAASSAGSRPVTPVMVSSSRVISRNCRRASVLILVPAAARKLEIIRANCDAVA
ncbi:hypothetical protein GCM10028864_37180 [Microlunatus parietis]